MSTVLVKLHLHLFDDTEVEVVRDFATTIHLQMPTDSSKIRPTTHNHRPQIASPARPPWAPSQPTNPAYRANAPTNSPPPAA